MTDIVRQHIEVAGAEGASKARVAGSRVRVQDVAVWHEKLGMSPDEIVDAHPTIGLADVHAAMAYYWDHRADIDGAIAEEQALAEEIARREPGPLQEKLRQRRGG